MKSSLQLKISIAGVTPLIWRRVVVNTDLSLEGMHYVIQAIMPWFEGHLHQFITEQRSYIAEDPFIEFEDIDSQGYDECVIGDLLSKEGDKMKYEYDFGNRWIHNIVVESVLPAMDNTKAKYITGRNGAPIEDCGGPAGYERLKSILTNPDHPEFKEMCEWIGMEEDMEFDPQFIEVEPEEVNVILQAVV